MQFIKTANRVILGGMETGFHMWGRWVATHPYPVILVSVIFTAVASLGFLRFRFEHQADLLWISSSSPYNINKDWLHTNFQDNQRRQTVIFQSENVLTPEAVQQMLLLHNRIQAITISDLNYNDICTRLPVADFLQTKRRKRREIEEQEEQGEDYDFWAEEIEEYDEYYNREESSLEQINRINFDRYGERNSTKENEDILDTLPDSIYCDLVNTLNEKCFVSSLLEIWRFNEEHIASTTQQEIINAVNLLSRTPWFGYDKDFSKLLGGISRNSTGHIVAARTSLMVWSIEVPDDVDIVDKNSLHWEEEFIQTVLDTNFSDTVVLPNAGKSFEDILFDTLYLDARLMFGGYILMFCYTILMLGRLNRVEVRMYLSLMGIFGIIMGMTIGMGISSLLGFPYTPLHSIIPFLCLGIGIDDMFVLVQCWTNLKVNPSISISEKIGLALKHGGISITVTSLTDVFAFGSGCISSMSGLQSFCVNMSFGLTAIFLLQVSWFVAWMSLDETRKKSGRDGVLLCLVHTKERNKIGCSNKCEWGVRDIYTYLLSSYIIRTVIIVITLTVFCFGVWGCSRMEIKFDEVLLLPGNTYLRKWFKVHKEFYPEDGVTAEVYSGTLNYTHQASVDKLVMELEILQETGYLRDVISWWNPFKEFIVQKTNFTSWQDVTTEKAFALVLSDFLYSSQGALYKNNFNFSSPGLVCNEATPMVTASKFSIEYSYMDAPAQHISAQGAVTNLLETVGGPYIFSHSQTYVVWETDQIIGFELGRNIGVAMVCVFGVTLVLLADIQICLYVLCIVGLTITDLVGFLHFWDITIDIVTCLNMVLAVGLCVDYSVHIAVAFLMAEGSRQDKAVESIVSMGPAVFNGGFTTFLAIILCSQSHSHMFLAFFKIFLLTVMFGMFHGLVFFPVLLSLLGPVSSTKESSVNSSSRRCVLSSVFPFGNSTPCSLLPSLPSLPPSLANIRFISNLSHKQGVVTTSWVESKGEL